MKPYLELSQGLLIPTYFLVISLVAILGLLWSLRRGNAQKKDPNTILDIYLALMIGSAIGSRLIHVFWEAPEYYSKDPIKVFYLWEGGFVFYGGFLGAFLAGLWLIIKRKLSLFEWLDFFAPVAALTYAVGRWGCWFAGCCYGKITDLPWAVHIHAIGESTEILRHPTPIYASLAEFTSFVVLLKLEKLKFFKIRGRLFSCWIILHGVGRLIMETYRDDDRGALLAGSSISWHLSYILILIGTILLLFSKKR